MINLGEKSGSSILKTKNTGRIFWLGMHKLLTKTELPRLSYLGYEVFAPPYLSKIVDQSAVKLFQDRSLSTLPDDIFDKLQAFNFFYNAIPSEIAEILNAYFDCVIVTINPDWLQHILKVFKGKVIYRTFGQPYSLSGHMDKTDLINLIDNRDNFWFAPHLEETAVIEDSWLRHRMKIIPYALGDEILPYKDTWQRHGMSGEVGMLCPRIEHPYYAANYRHIKFYFGDMRFPIFGVQFQSFDDPQVVGTLDRTHLLERFQRLNGFLYHYKEPTVTYLPPIEVMMIGGPVIHFRQSLIGRLFEPGAPGSVTNEADAMDVATRLLRRDVGLMREMIASQEKPRAHYDPTNVWPKFDRAFREMLGPSGDNEAPRFFTSVLTETSAAKAEVPAEKAVFLPFHRLGFTIRYTEGRYTSAEGIVRVARLVVKALTETTNYHVVVGARAEHMACVLGFFQETVADPTRIQVLCVDGAPADAAPEPSRPRPRSRAYREWRKFRKASMERALTAYMLLGGPGRAGGGALAASLHGMTQAVARASGKARAVARYGDVRILIRRVLDQAHMYRQQALTDYRYNLLSQTENYVPTVNGMARIEHVFIPHYYLFPEAVDFRKRVVLYLPDHMPSIMPAGAFEDEIVNNAIGRAIAHRASAIMTNSKFSAEYLPRSPLRVRRSRIHAFSLPNLNQGADRTKEADPSIGAELPFEIEKDRYAFVFYPTQNRPNKRLTILAEAVAATVQKIAAQGVILSMPEIALVLTCAPDPRLVELASPVPVFFVTGVSDAALTRLYRKAACLCFTSVAEGNFPTQLTEALSYRVPIVATRMPLILAELGDAAESLVLCEPDNPEDLAQGIVRCLTSRQAVLDRQDTVRELIAERGAWDRFASNVKALFTTT